MEGEEEKCQVSCYEACEGGACANEPEDVVIDFEKMTPGEKGEFLESLLQNRYFGC
jgi:hypothetical protein